jgi:hypothetical protein
VVRVSHTSKRPTSRKSAMVSRSMANPSIQITMGPPGGERFGGMARLTRPINSVANGVGLLLDSRVVIGQFLRNRLFLQAFHEGRDRCSIFGKSRLISSLYVLSMLCKTLESNKSQHAKGIESCARASPSSPMGRSVRKGRMYRLCIGG